MNESSNNNKTNELSTDQLHNLLDKLQRENIRLQRELEIVKNENSKLQNAIRNLQVQLESLEDATSANIKPRKKVKNGTW